MVHVINAIGFVVPANTAIDLSPYLEGDIAGLIGVRTTVRALQTVLFTGVAVAAHTHNVEVEAVHTHVVEEEVVHTHVIGISFGAAVSDAGHTHVLTVYAAGAFTPTTLSALGFQQTVDAQGGVYESVGAAPVVGAIETNLAIHGGGWLDAAPGALGANSVALTGRREITMGDAVVSTTMLELRVLYARDAAGIF